jgi:membrane protease subunit HflK
MLKKIKEWFERHRPKGYGEAAFLVVPVLGGLWLLSGFYQVSSNQVGVVMRFGAYERTEQPGLRYHLPAPIEDVLLPVVTSQNEIQVGFRRVSMRGVEDMRPVPEESMMLTQDENIINVEFAVFWRVSDVAKYLFEIRDPEMTIKMAAESVMREVIGQNKLQFALTDGRSEIADEARVRLQALMDEYNAGIIVSQINLQTVSVPDEVKAAFQDVVNARLDQERFQNQAAAHANKVVPDAKGQAAQLLQQAMGYRDQKIAIAQGDADRFKEVLAAYNVSRDVTAKRLYLETMESILKDAKKVIVEKGGVVPYLPLPGLAPAAKSEGDK